MKKNEKKNAYSSAYKKKRIGSFFAHLGIFLLITIVLLVGAVYAAAYVLLKGPSPTMQETLTLSLRETSAIYWIPNLFMSSEKIQSFYESDTEGESAAQVTNVSLITISPREEQKQTAGDNAGAQDDPETKDAPEIDPDGDGIDIIPINSGTYKGFMAIIYDPTTVVVGTSRGAKGSSSFGGAGVQLTEMCEAYGAILGINGGEFEDVNGGGSGGTPQGIVIEEGKITYGSRSTRASIIGFDYDGVLHVGTMTGQQALDANMRWAVSFGPALIINGESQTEHKKLVSGVNPRTAIGQRADGAVLMLVIDGRQVKSLGATYDNLIDIMLEFGAVNASNLDGGSSTMMVFNGEILNNCASVYGPRPLPSCFLVVPHEGTDE